LIDLSEDGKWLSNIILHANETMARSDNEQLPATLIVFKEDLERKKDIIKNKYKELSSLNEDFQNELKGIFDEQENQTNFAQAIEQVEEEDIHDEFEKIREENEKLKNKLESQSYEIGALTSQLKFEETKRLPPHGASSSRDLRSSRGRTNKDISRMSSNKYQDDDETDVSVPVIKAMAEVSGASDLLLMLQSQASSIEILLTNGY